jgi:Cys-tRNA(Pro)/Cys-tRNA(Cys) deacylase
MTDQLRTPAIAALEAAGVPFRVVQTEIARSAEESAAFQGIPVGSLLRSILVRRAADDFFFVLVPGGRRFNWPALRALLGTNRLTLPTEEEAKAETGYVRGAITPFGARRPWPVIADASIEGLEIVAIGGGARGVNVHLAPADLVRATGAQVVDITVPEPAPEPAEPAPDITVPEPAPEPADPAPASEPSPEPPAES